MDQTVEERALFEEEVTRQSSQGIELLKYGGGEIEDYMPSRLTDIGEVTDLVSNNNWIIDVEDEATRIHLASLLCRILDVDEKRRSKFVESVRQRVEVFEMQD